MNGKVSTIIYLMGGAVWLWFAWRTLRTGMPAGNPAMNPRRDERPVQFWFVFAAYLGLGAYALSHIRAF